MIDRKSRDIAQHLLTRYLSGELTPEEFESDWSAKISSSRDAAIAAIEWAAWFTYSDIGERRTRPANPGSYERALLERCVRFLATNDEYDWGDPSPKRLRTVFRDVASTAIWPFSKHDIGKGDL